MAACMSASAEEQPVTDLMLIQIEGRLEGGGVALSRPPPLLKIVLMCCNMSHGHSRGCRLGCDPSCFYEGSGVWTNMCSLQQRRNKASHQRARFDPQ